MIYRVLVFEDEDVHFDLIRKAFAQQAPSVAPKVEVVHFKNGFFPSDAAIRSIDNDGDPPAVWCYPGNISGQPKAEYFQTDFDAAILDQFKEDRGMNWGEKYLQWFEVAGFIGNISVVSQRPRTFGGGGRVISHTKDDAGRWADEAVHHVLMERKPHAVPDEERDYRVNYKGRNPQEFLTGVRGFYTRHAFHLKLPAWRQAFVGQDESLAQSLAEFFKLDRTPQPVIATPVADIVSKLASDRNLRSVLHSARVIWFDFGEELTQADYVHVRDIIDALKSGPVIPVLLANHLSLDNDRRIPELAAVWVPRSNMLDAAERAHWAGKSIEDFAQLYFEFERTAKHYHGKVDINPETWNEATLKAATLAAEGLLPALLLTRNMSILCGRSGCPPFSRWISQEAGAILNQNLASRMTLLVKELHALPSPRLSERQRNVLAK